MKQTNLTTLDHIGRDQPQRKGRNIYNFSLQSPASSVAGRTTEAETDKLSRRTERWSGRVGPLDDPRLNVCPRHVPRVIGAVSEVATAGIVADLGEDADDRAAARRRRRRDVTPKAGSRR